MSMKRKIRRAFRHATPDVLGSILQSFDESVSGNTNSTESKIVPLPKQRPHWVMEVAATAAALALLIGVCGSIFLLRGDQLPAGNNDPTQTHNQTQNTSPTYTPIDRMNAEDIVSNLVWPMVYPDAPNFGDEGWDAYQIYQEENTTIEETTKDGRDYYHFTVHHEGYTYYFEYDSGPDGCLAIKIIPCDCVREGYLAEEVVLEMARIHFGVESIVGWETVADFIEVKGAAHYLIKYVNTSLNTTVSCYINAITGTITDELEMLTEKEALKIAMEHLGLNADTGSPGISLMPIDGRSCYVVTAFHPNKLAHVSCCVDAYTGQIANSDDSSLTDMLDARDFALDYLGLSPDQLRDLIMYTGGNGYYTVDISSEENGHSLELNLTSKTVENYYSFDSKFRDDELRSDLIGWQAARDIAMADAGTSIQHMIGFSYSLHNNSGRETYSLTFTCGNQEYLYILDALSGDILYSPAYTAFLRTEEVWNILMMHSELPNAVKEAYAEGNVTRSSCELSQHNDYLAYVIDLLAGGFEISAGMDVFDGTITSFTATQIEEPEQIVMSEEMEFFQNLFCEHRSWYNMALECQYISPMQIPLARYFFNGFSDESRTPTDVEWRELQNQPGFDIGKDLIRLPVAKMNETLLTYFGITLDEMDEDCFDGLVYLESTDCYYSMTDDMEYAEYPQVSAVEALDNGTVKVYYTANISNSTCVVTLRLTDYGYHIISNVLDVDIPEGDFEITGSNSNGINIISGLDLDASDNGFFWDESGSAALSIHNGTPEFLRIYEEQPIIFHNGKRYEFYFKWCTNDGEIGVYADDLPTVEPIPGNDNYVMISFANNGRTYSYLFNLRTDEHFDPLAVVNKTILNKLTRCSFSPNAKSALLYTDDNVYYLDIESETVTTIAALTGIEGANEVTYISSNLIAVSSVDKSIPQNWYTDCVAYDLTNNSSHALYTDQAYDRLIEASGMAPFNRLHIYNGDSGLCFVDCATGKQAQLDMTNYQDIGICGIDNVYVRTHDGTVCLVEPTGTAIPVFSFDLA